MTAFEHEKLEVYQAAIEFVATASALIKRLPAGHGDVADQLRRAAVAIPLNIAEGAGESGHKERARSYRMAKRSATECAAILDVLRVMKLADETELVAGRDLLQRIVSTIAGMSKRPGGRTGTDGGRSGRGAKSGAGTDTGTGTGMDEKTAGRK